MTVTAPAPAPSRTRRQVPLAPMRAQAAKTMTTLADQMKQSHPDLLAHQHVRDAAKMLKAGNEEAAQRHLRAAAFGLSPQSLMRHGLHTDDAHIAARNAMDGVHRHMLLVKNVQDADAGNRAMIAKLGGEDDTAPRPKADPNNGYGPGALAQKPTVRQPPGDQALNAPAQADGGGSDPAAADPNGPQPKGSKQFATWGDVASAIELVGPGGWKHGWAAGGPTAADHDKAAKLHTQAAAKTKNPAAKAQHLRRAKVHAQVARKLRALSPDGNPAGLAYGWDDLDRIIEMSAKTAALESTPALYGKPGGPGLYGVAGQKHSDYFEQLVKAFTEKRGMDKAGASRMAWGVLRKWSAGGGHVHPEVRAAASKALAEEEGKAKAAHSHATSWDDVERDIELAAAPPPAAGSPAKQQAVASEARVAAGQAGGGQFTAGGGGQPAKGKAPAKQTPAQKAAAAAAAKAHAAHVAHVAHVAHASNVSTKKANLLVTAQDDRQQAAGLIKQRNALQKALASASGKVSSGQAGSTTSANSTTSTSAPATASTSAAAPAASTTASTTASSAPSASKTSTTAAAPKAGSAAAIKAQIGQLNTQINQLLAQAKQAETQAATMK